VTLALPDTCPGPYASQDGAGHLAEGLFRTIMNVRRQKQSESACFCLFFFRDSEGGIMATGTAVQTTATASLAPVFARVPDELRRHLGAGIADLAEIRLMEEEFPSLRRFLGLRMYQGHGRPATARVLTLVFLALVDGPVILNVSDLSRRAGVSRPTTYRALRFVAAPTVGRPKLVRLDPRSTGPRRPGRWQIRPDILENAEVRRAQENAASAASVNSKDSREAERQNQTSSPETGRDDTRTSPSTLLGLRPAAGHPCNDEAASLVQWLDDPNVNLGRPASFAESRKLAAAVRLVADRRLADPLLAALFWRTRTLPLAAWRAAIHAIISSNDRWERPQRSQYHGDGFWTLRADPGDDHWAMVSRRELEWRARLAVQHLIADSSDAAGFAAILEDGLPRTSGTESCRLLGVERAIEKAVHAVREYRRALLSQVTETLPNGTRYYVKPEGVCSICGGAVSADPWGHKCHDDLAQRVVKLRALRLRILGSPLLALSSAEVNARLDAADDRQKQLLECARRGGRSPTRCPTCGKWVQRSGSEVSDCYRQLTRAGFVTRSGPHECWTAVIDEKLALRDLARQANRPTESPVEVLV